MIVGEDLSLGRLLNNTNAMLQQNVQTRVNEGNTIDYENSGILKSSERKDGLSRQIHGTNGLYFYIP